MALVIAKCTGCGANINVDDSKRSGICEFCRAEFVTQDVIKNTHITKNFAGANINIVKEDVESLLIMARKSLDIENIVDAMNRIDRVLEVEPTSSKVWLMKIEAYSLSPSTTWISVNEVVQSGEYAIKYADIENQLNVRNEVYNYHIIISKRMIDEITDNSTCLVSGKSVVILIEKIPAEHISSSKELQVKIRELAKKYVEQASLHFISGEEIQDNLNIITRGLPKEDVESINKKSDENIGTGKGCGIALLFVVGSFLLVFLIFGGGSTRTVYDVMGLTSEQAVAMRRVLTLVNVGEIESVRPWDFGDQGPDGATGFIIRCSRAHERDYIVVWLDEYSNEVVRITYRFNVLVDQGEKVAERTRHFSWARGYNRDILEWVQMICEPLVSDFFDSPEFSSASPLIRIYDNVITVFSTVRHIEETGLRETTSYRVTLELPSEPNSPHTFSLENIGPPIILSIVIGFDEMLEQPFVLKNQY